MGLSRSSSVSASASNEKQDKKLSDNGLVTQGIGRIDEEGQQGEVVDGVFGAQGANTGTVNYRAVGWVSTSVLLAKSQIGLGVLSLPDVLHTLGMVPALIIIVAIAVMSTWTDWIIGGPWKAAHPTCYSVADCGGILGGRIGREIFGGMYWLLMTCIAGSALLGLSTALNAISLHGTCTAVFVAVAAVATFFPASLRTLGSVKWIGWAGLLSMIVSILLVAIAVGAGGRPSPAPQEGPWDKDIVYFGNPSFADAMNAVSNIVFSYAGTAAFLPIASEMRNPKDFKKAVLACQSFVTAFYLAVSIVVYMYAGQYVASPALGTAGVLIKRVAYGLALPGLLAAAVIYTHLPAKYIFVRAMRNSKHLTHSSPTHWMAWLSCTLGCVLFSYVIASAIPVFGGLVGLIGALFGSFLTLTGVAWMWFFDNWTRLRNKELRTAKVIALAAFNAFISLAGIFICIGGTYGSVISIRDDYAASGGHPWSCADNSGSS
ncbi:hypothetical protein JCM10213_000314 [Rhodosporidiobolus nylandii]